MAPKLRTIKVPESEWARHKDTILELFLFNERTLKEIAEYMEINYHFIATISQYEAQLRVWRARKRLTTKEWEPIFKRLDSLRPGTRSRVMLSGRPVPEQQVRRARRHWKSRSVPERHHTPDDRSGVNESADAYIEVSSPGGTWHRLPESMEPTSYSALPQSESETVESHTPMLLDPSKSTQQVRQDSSPGTLAHYPTTRLYAGPTVLDSLTLPTFDETLGSPNFAFGQSPSSPTILERELSNSIIPSRHTQPLPRDGSINFSDYLRGESCYTPSISAVPSKWLNLLPYENFVRGELSGQNETNLLRVGRNITGLLHENMGSFLSSGSTGKNWKSALNAFSTLLPGDTFEATGGDRDYPWAADEMKLTHLFIFSMANGLAGLEDIPMKSIGNVLTHSQSIIGLFMHLIKANKSLTAKALAETLFRVAIEMEESNVLSQILTTDHIDVNRTGRFVTSGCSYTALEYAAKFQNLDIVEGLLKANASLNKRFFDFFASMGEVRIISTQWLRAWDFYWQRQFPYIEVRWHETKAFQGAKWTAEAIQLCLETVLNPVEHYCLFEIRFLEQIPPVLDDLQATDAIRSILQACGKTGCGNCLQRYSMEVGRAAAIGTKHGRFSFVALLLPSCDDIWTNVVLGLSIGYRETALTAFALAHIKSFDFFTDKSIMLDEIKGTQLVEEMLRTPLAAAILTEDKLLVHRLELAGALNPANCKKQYLFQDILAAAVQVQDVEYIRKLLAHFPSPPVEALNYATSFAIRDQHYQIATELIRMEPDRSLAEHKVSLLAKAIRANKVDVTLLQPSDYLDLAAEIGDLGYVRKHLTYYLQKPGHNSSLESALGYAIENCHDEIAFELLNAGADVNKGLPKKLLTQAIIHRNARLVHAILNSDIGPHGADIGTFKEALIWGDKSVIKDLVETFLIDFWRTEELKVVPLSDFPETENVDLIKCFLSHWGMTADQLSLLLRTAVEQNNHVKARFFLEEAANASRREILESATEGHPALLYSLLQRDKDLSMLPFGARVLRVAIEEGPGSTETLDLLLSTNMVNLEGNSASQDQADPKYISPLGFAIQQYEKGKDPEFIIIKRLLEAGCIVNKIAHSETIGPECPIIASTALLLAIKTRDKELVQLLIDHGADVYAPAALTVKRTPLQQAAEVGSLEIVKLLLIKHGVDVNAAPSARSGGTALQFAAISGNCNIAAELLAHGACLYAPPSKVNGRWPIEGAAEHGRLDMIKCLWMAQENTTFPSNIETGFEEVYCQRAMKLAEQNGHVACRDFIAELAGLNEQLT
ncbi:hypothetical protein Hte_002322 [Hypoxylon texense]